MEDLSDESFNEAVTQASSVLGLTYVKKLGRGSYGTVFLAEDANGKKHAVKVCSIVGPEYLVRYVRREYQLQQTIRHRNVVQMYGGIDTNPRFMVMDLEFCNTDLQKLIVERAEKGFTDAEIRRMFKDILRGLNALHSRGILHRDLKPANLMVTVESDGTFTVKVGDLGFAKKEVDGIATQLGTPLYEAPEIYLGTGDNYGCKCDIWSVGLILQEILFRKHPYHPMMDKHGLRPMLKKQMPVTIEEGRGVSECCRHFVNNFLFYDPDSRYSVPEALAHPFLMECAQVVSFTGKGSPARVSELKPREGLFGETVFNRYMGASSFEKLSMPHAVSSWDVTWGDVVQSSKAGSKHPEPELDPNSVLVVSDTHEIHRITDRCDVKEWKNMKVLVISSKDSLPELTICDNDPEEGIVVSQFLDSNAKSLGARTLTCLNKYLDKGTDLRRCQRSLLSETNSVVRVFEFLGDTLFSPATGQALVDEIEKLQDRASEVIPGFSPISVTAPEVHNPALTELKGAERAQKTELHNFIANMRRLKEAAEQTVRKDRYHINVSHEVAELRDVITSFTRTREEQGKKLKSVFTQLQGEYVGYRNATPALLLVYSYAQCLREALNSRTPSGFLARLNEFHTKFAARQRKDDEMGLLRTYREVAQERDQALEELKKNNALLEQAARTISMLREALKKNGIPDPTEGM